MKVRSFGYLMKEGLKNLWRNRMMSVASIGSVTATLIILGMIFILMININSLAQGAKDQFDTIQVYLKEEITQEEIGQAGEDIKEIEGIKEVQFESKKDALKKMKEGWGEHGYLLDGLEENPLPDSYIIYLEDIQYSTMVVNEIQSLENIEEVKFYKDIIDKLIGITNFIKIVGLVIIVILIAISIFIIGNTIKLTVAARRREINIMKYVGATNWFIRWPFFFEGTLLGVIGAMIATTIVYFAYDYVYNIIANQLYVIIIAYILPSGYILSSLIYIFIVLGAGIGALGSIMSMRKHLRV